MFRSLFNRQNRRSERREAKPRRPFRLLHLEDRLVPASIQVTTTADTGAGSLRAAIIAANGSAGLDTINFTGAAFSGNATINLTTGELAISDSVIIDATSKFLVTVSGNTASRIFNINDGKTGTAINVTLTDLILTKGDAGANDGGAMFVQDENVALSGCTISSNDATDGGAIRLEAAGAKLTVDSCTFNGNAAVGGGGAISAAGGPTVVIDNTTFSANQAVSGGAINMFQGGSLTVRGSTFAFNFTNANDGGAMFLNGTFATQVIRNCTFAGNQASSDGGAISLSSSFGPSLTVQNSTFASNLAINDNGGAIARTGGTAQINIISTIVANNSAGASGEDIFTAGTVDGDFSLIETTAGITTKTFDATTNANVGKDPQLGALTNNGGLTLTLLPAATSPVVDAGSNPTGLTVDQRGTGYFRTRGSATDIGAVERPADFVVLNTANSGAGSLRQAILDANTAVGDDTIVFDSTTFNSAQSITLTSGEMAVTDVLTIVGPTGKLTVSGNNASRIFNVGVGVSPFALSNMTLTKGSGGSGGALVTASNTTLTNVSITSSKATGSGGAIFTSGGGVVLGLDSCSLTGNSAAVAGGGIGSFANINLEVNNSSIASNTAGTSGGGIAMASTNSQLLILSSTLALNTAVAGDGGGLLLSGAASGASNYTIRNSTFSGNTASGGGGAFAWTGASSGDMYLQNSTLTANRAGLVGGGIARLTGSAIINIESTVVSGNATGTLTDISSAGVVRFATSALGSSIGFVPVDLGGNLADGSDLKLGPLTSNGGPFSTHAPAQDSPLLSKGSNPAGLTSDQRGGATFPRVRGAAIDIGAVEVSQFVVTNTAASGAGSLAQAVTDANAFGGADTITFDPTIFSTLQVINLSGTLNLNSSMEIEGPAAKVTLSGVAANRHFSMANAFQWDFLNLNLTLGKGASDGGSILLNQANAVVNFTNCNLSFNTTSAQGGAFAATSVSTNAKVTFTDCTIGSNTTTGATQDGGAIRINAGTLTLVRSAITNNTATGDGGALSLAAGTSLLVQETTLSGNSAALTGGGIALTGAAGAGGFKVLNSTLSGNKSGQDGGGLSWQSSTGTLTLQNATLTNNTASSGGGGGLSVSTGTGSLNIESTIVSGNTNAGAPDIDNPNTTTLKNSAVGDNLGFVKTDAGGNLPFQPHANLKLSVLGGFGGPTSTHVPQTGSPLINAGSNPAGLTTEQRGVTRTISGVADIGATEFTDFVVRNINDAGFDSLRDWVNVANTLSGANTITFDPTVFATAKTITLTTGEIEVTDNTTITGPNARVSVSGNNASRVFYIDGATPLNVSLSNLIIRDGNGSGKTASVGGGIAMTDDTVSLTNCDVIHNTVGASGGGLMILDGTGSTLNVTASTFAHNVSTGNSGGGIALGTGTSVITIIDSTICDNSAHLLGGGVSGSGSGTITVRNSTFSGNTAGTSGGAIRALSGTLTVQNSTLAGNTAFGANGGAISCSPTTFTTIDSSILFGNSAATGPEISSGGPGTVTANASLISSTAGITTFVGDAFTNANIGVDPQLGPLANNGGLTLTHLPASGSKAIGNGSNPAALTADQRGKGFARVIGPIDVGAVETRELIVLNTNNSGVGSLRQAVLDANAAAPAGATTITFDATTFATSKNIILTTGELAVTGSVNIVGPAAGVVISGNLNSRVFNVNGSGVMDVSMSDLTLTFGKPASGSGGGLLVADEKLSLSRVTLIANSASSGGGLITSADSELTMTDCTVTNNTAASAAGVGIGSNSKFTMKSSTVSHNTATTGGGGGIDLSIGQTLIENVTIFGNSAKTNGAGVYFVGANTATLRNVTISGNTAGGSSGGIGWQSSGGVVTIQNSTIVSNTAATAGGGITQGTGNGVFAIESSIIFGNTGPAGPDLDNPDNGSFITLKNSLVGTTSGGLFTNSGGNLIGVNPLLGPLTNNGGKTLTHLPAINSPAVDAGSNPAGLTLDQRGLPRSLGGIADIGAVEARAFIVRNANDAGPGSLRQNLIDSNALAGADTVSFDATQFATPQTITLTTGELTIADDLSLEGPTNNTVTVSGGDASRVFNIGSKTVALSYLTIRDGFTGSFGAGINASATTLTLTACDVVDNTALSDGGGIYGSVSPVITLLTSSISGNSSGGHGGGIQFFGGLGNLTVNSSLISSNKALGTGGGIITGNSQVTILNSTVSSNTSGAGGGGISTANSMGNFKVQNSTFTGNQAGGNGGGIQFTSGGAQSMASNIFFGNKAGFGAEVSHPGTLNVTASLFGTKLGVTTFSADAFTNANIGVDPLLGPLAGNSGQTKTHLPAVTSVVRNNGVNPSSLSTDQRGAVRATGAAIDIGAVEIQEFVVTNTGNTGAFTLRQGVTYLQSIPTPEALITFLPAAFATHQTITLTTGQIDIGRHLAIIGPAAGVTVSGNKADNIFVVAAANPLSVYLAGMTLTDASGSAILFSDDDVTLQSMTLFGNTATNGGALSSIFTGAKLTIVDSTLSNNSATVNGGAVSLSGDGSSLTLRRSLIANNQSGLLGGGLHTEGHLLVEDSAITGNTSASHGGGAYVRDILSVLVRNSTVSSNQGVTGGGMAFLAPTVTLNFQNSTVTANKSSGGAGGLNVIGISSETIALESTVVSGNSAPSLPDIQTSQTVQAKNSAIGSNSMGAATFVDLGGNVPFGVDAKLGPLTNNGGPTPTHALLPGSPLINKGSNPAALTTDQRGVGFARVNSGTADIGAFESKLAPTVVTAVLGDGTNQRSMVKQLVVTFSEPVTFSGSVANAFTLTRTGTGGSIGTVTLTATPPTGVAGSVTLTFSGVRTENGSLIDGLYDLTINAGLVSGANGALDGNVDGVAGGNFAIVGTTANKWHRLFGDVNGDGFTDNVDLIAYRAANGSDSTMVNYNAALDFNNDGFIDNVDFIAFRQRLGLVP